MPVVATLDFFCCLSNVPFEEDAIGLIPYHRCVTLTSFQSIESHVLLIAPTIGKQSALIEAIHLIVPRLKRQLAHPLRLLHPLVPVQIHDPLVAPLPQLLHVPTLAVDAEIRKGIRLRIDPIVRQDIRVRVADLVLQQHVDAVPEMDPPEFAMPMLERLVMAVVLKGHLAELVEAVRLVEGVEGGNVGVVAHVPMVVRETGRGFGVLAQGHDVGAADGEEVAGLISLPQLVDFGAGLAAAPGGVLGWPERAVESDVVELHVDVVE